MLTSCIWAFDLLSCVHLVTDFATERLLLGMRPEVTGEVFCLVEVL